MGRIFRIGGALVLGTVMVGAAFLSSKANDGVSSAAAQVVVTEVPKIAQEVKDSDGDGRRDWEEELRGTDPFAPDDWDKVVEAPAVLSTPASDYVPPTTLTGQFAESFFEDYVRTSGGRPLTDEQQAQFVSSAVSSLVRESSGESYTRVDLNIGGESGVAPIRDYGNEAGLILVSGLEFHENALIILQEALKADDPEVLTRLAPMEDAYRVMLDDLLKLSVPPALVQEHVDLVNVIAAIRDDVVKMSEAFDDPLEALVNAKEYPSDVEHLPVVVNNIRLVLEQAGIVYTRDEWGMFFFSLRP